MWQCPWCNRWDEDPEDHTAHVLDCPHRRFRDDILPYVIVPEAEISNGYGQS